MKKRTGASRQPEHFERLYRANPDPWNLASSAYEQQKYDATLAALGTRQFQMALEVGCSIGTLTERLASRCDRLIGLDFAPFAVAAARARCAACPGVSIERMHVPRQWPDGRFDLIVFSEVLYFFEESDLLAACEHARHSVVPGGEILLVNYTLVNDTPMNDTGPIDDRYDEDPYDGDTAASLFIRAAAPEFQLTLQRRNPLYRLDLLSRQ